MCSVAVKCWQEVFQVYGMCKRKAIVNPRAIHFSATGNSFCNSPNHSPHLPIQSTRCFHLDVRSLECFAGACVFVRCRQATHLKHNLSHDLCLEVGLQKAGQTGNTLETQFESRFVSRSRAAESRCTRHRYPEFMNIFHAYGLCL